MLPTSSRSSTTTAASPTTAPGPASRATQPTQVQATGHAPHRLGPPDRPERRTSNAVFSLRREAFLAVVSLLLVLAGEIEMNPKPNCYTCRKPMRRGMIYLQCQANSCTNGSHKQLRCSGFHRSQLTNSWRCPPHGGPGPPHRAPTTSSICDSCQQPIRAAASPPAREGGCVDSIVNQTTSRKQSLVGLSLRYNNKNRTTQLADPVGTATATSPALSTHSPAAAATLRSIAPVPD